MPDNTLNTPQEEVKLKRSIGFWSLVFFGIVFMQPTSGLTLLGYTQYVSQGHSVMTFLIGTVVVFFTCMSYAKMVEVYPNAGSAYTYTARGLNSKIGFLVGWVMLLDYVLNPMLIYAIAGLYLNRFVPSIPVFVWVILIAVAVWAVNIIGLEVAKLFNLGAAVFQLLLAAVFVILSTIYLTKSGSVSPSYVIFRPDEFDLGGVIGATTIVVLTFLGFDGISTVTEESTVPPKTVGKAIKTAVLIQALFLIVLAFFGSMLQPDYTKIEHIDTIVYDLYLAVGGPVFNTAALLIGQFLAIMATNTIVLSGSRLLYAMGRDGVVPRNVFGYLSPKYQTPTRGITVITIVCIIGALAIGWADLAQLVAFGAMIGFACVNITVVKVFFIDRKEHKIFSNLIFPILGLLFVLLVMFASPAICKIVGGGWLLIGIIYLVIRYKSSQEFRDAVNKGLGM